MIRRMIAAIGWPKAIDLALGAVAVVLVGIVAWQVGSLISEQREAIEKLRLELREPGALLDDPAEAESVPEREEVFRTVPDMLERLREVEALLADLCDADPECEPYDDEED